MSLREAESGEAIQSDRRDSGLLRHYVPRSDGFVFQAAARSYLLTFFKISAASRQKEIIK